MKSKLLLLIVILLSLFSCNLELVESDKDYTFFYLKPTGFTIIIDDNFQYISPNTNFKMGFDADLLTKAEIAFDPTELNEYLISKTIEYNIKEWEIYSANNGFEFIGTSID